MPFALTLLVLWPIVLIGVSLAAAAILRGQPDHYDDVWLLPRPSSLRPGA